MELRQRDIAREVFVIGIASGFLVQGMYLDRGKSSLRYFAVFFWFFQQFPQKKEA